ncbi:hypothetical protein EVAR_49219_1 [Eumeta japonica]|uniref:Uncharacterized protein n=1 Tax=Eumeta variegata TaxID=151549 RepID=A0A4C1XRT6_EUMVA|nr:hypothetical protein EVAR_49219_1 [Eumeta japonica]
MEATRRRYDIVRYLRSYITKTFFFEYLVTNNSRLENYVVVTRLRKHIWIQIRDGVSANARSVSDGRGSAVTRRGYVVSRRAAPAVARSALSKSNFDECQSCGWESLMKSVTLGNVTMSHRTERPAECFASLSHSTMIGLPRAD